MGSQTGNATAVIAVTSVRIERDKLARFRKLAAANRRSVSQELRWLIDQAVEEYERKDAA
jgi:hypothetical protein